MPPDPTCDPVLAVSDLRVAFGGSDHPVQVVCGVDLALYAGQTLCVVGESGSGKSLTLQALLGMIPVLGGQMQVQQLSLGGRSLAQATQAQWRAVRGKHIAIVHQDPLATLNPYLRVGDQIAEVLVVHDRLSRKAAWQRAVAVLGDAGLADPDARARDYPHQLSGGQRQRVALAMALVAHPQVLLADEPTTALDATTQAHVLQWLRQIQQMHTTAVLWVSHDMAVVAHLADQVAVMYAGQMQEMASVHKLFAAPRHPYTASLLASRPNLQRRGQPLVVLPGAPPAADQWPSGCRFAPRCPLVLPQCRTQAPALQPLADDPTRSVRCFRPQAVAAHFGYPTDA